MSQTPDASSKSSRSSLFLCLGVVLAAAIGVSSRAFAFTNPSDYGTYPGPDPASKGFGAGRYFTGSPADGYSCEVCHSATPVNYSFPLVHKGLPLDGYVPGKQYKIEITWPEAKAAYMTAQTQGYKPVTSLVAEFVAEDGGPAGTVAFPITPEVAPAVYSDLYCDTLPMAAQGEELAAYATDIYVQDTGSLATVLSFVPTTKAAEAFGGKCTVERGKDAEGNEYERRCIIAMRGCGAQRVKFTWTAPDEWRGPIWFSAGFVTTYDRSTAPNDSDFVSTLSIPLNPGYKGGEYVNELQSGCSVAHGPRAHSGSERGFALVLFSLLGVAVVRRRQRRAGAWIVAALALCGVGCDKGQGLITNVAGSVGAYEAVGCTNTCTPPIECRESAWPDAGTAEEAAEAKKMMSGMMSGGPSAAAGAGAAGAGADPGVKSLGSITAQFVTAQPPELVSDWVKVDACAPIPNCMPHYVTVWIDVEQEGKRKYVRTLQGSNGMFRALSLVRYYRLGADCQVPSEVVPVPTDAITSASIYVHQSHTVTWDGLYGSGHKAAEPGLYHLRIEVAIDEAHHFEVADIPFMFGGPAPTTETSLPQPAHTGVTISYTPSPP